MKKIANIFYLGISISIFSASCVKDRNIGPDFSSTQPVLELRTPVSNIAGLTNFGKAVIGNLSDTVKFYANLASNNTLGSDISITLGLDQTRINDYNADSNNAVKYELLPDSTYKLLKTSGTIAAGQRIDSFQVVFYKDKIDGSKNYMLPIAIIEAGNNILISQNQGVIYFHAIGNPIAGVYDERWERWNASDTTGDPTYDLEVGPVGFSPINPTEIAVQSQGTGEIDHITFTNNNGVLSNFDVFFDPDEFASLGITLTSGPFLLEANSDTGTYIVYFTYKNGSGDPRCIKNTYTKQ